MKKLILFCLLACSPLLAQTHKFCSTDANCTWTGNQIFSGSLAATGSLSAGAASVSSLNTVQLADVAAGVDACAKINTAIALLPSTGGTVDARGFQGTQVCNTAIAYTGATKGVTIIQGASTLQFSSSVTSPAIALSGAGSRWIGSGPEAKATGSSVIQAGTGFTGVLFQIGTVSGDTNLAIQDVKIDGNSVATVTAGLEVTANNINWTLISGVSIVNVTNGAGILWDTGVQEVRLRDNFQSNNLTCNDMGSGIVSGVWNYSPRLLCNGYAYIIGPDDAISAHTSLGIFQDGGDIASTGSADGTKPLVLVRNARNVQFHKVWWETSAAQTGTSTAMIQLGTINSTPNGFQVIGGHINGNNKANNFVDIEAASSPVIEPGAGTSINTNCILNNSTTSQAWIREPASNCGAPTFLSSSIGLAFAFGGSPQFLFTLLDFSAASGTTGFALRTTGDTTDRIFMQSNGTLRFGTGSGTNDLGISRSAAGVLAIGNGSAGNTTGSVSATNYIASGHLNQIATNDYSGTISVSAATSGSASFVAAYTSTPACTLTPTSDPTAVGVYWVTATTSAVTANVKTSGTITFNYHCIGNPN